MQVLSKHSNTYVFVSCLLKSHCSKFVHQIVNSLSAGNLSSWNFYQHFLPDHISHGWCVLVVPVVLLSISHHDIPHCALTVAENKWLMEVITAAYCWRIINKLPHCVPCNIIPSSSPQDNYIPSFQTLSAIQHADSSVNSYALHSKQHTGCR
jgi:hypothetical protein